VSTTACTPLLAGLRFHTDAPVRCRAKTVGAPLLHCPNASAVAAFKAALRRGDIFLHGFPHDGEAS